MSPSAPVNFNLCVIYFGFMAQEIKATLKQKFRKSSSLSSESEKVSPDSKKIFISTLHSMPSEADKSIHDGSLDDSRARF